MNPDKCFFIQLAIVYFCTTTTAQNLTSTVQDARREDEIQRKFDDWRFKDYIQKFDPRTVWERVDKIQTERGSNYTSEKYLDIMFHSMDETDDLLKLRVQNIGPPPEGTKPQTVDQMLQDTRRWEPTAGLNPNPKDMFDLRVRIYELMRQAIYQARNAMVIMQMMREKYRNSSLYKMGFLMSKTDNSVKTFSKFAFRIFRQCGLTRAGVTSRQYLYDTLVTEERLLHLWFNSQLLIDLINRNDHNCKQMLQKHSSERVSNWKFED